MCQHLGIKILTLEFSKFGNRFVVSHQIDRIDTPEKYSEIILKKERTREELFDYLKKSKPLIGDEYLIKKKISKSEKIKAAVDYFFLPQSDYFNNVFLNYGKTKLNTFYKGSSKRFYLKKSSRQSFLDKNTLKKIQTIKKPVFILIKIKKSDKVSTRVELTPIEIKERFMKYLSK